MIKTCKRCGKTFNSRYKGAKYCSTDCFHGTRPFVNCLVCNKEFQTYPCHVKAGRAKYCSRKCYTESMKGIKRPERSGQNAPNWKGGKVKMSSGYVKLYQPYHPRADKNGKIFEHILAVEGTIKRFLNSTETIHHIDENTSNNSPDNLYIFETTGKHSAYHNALRRGDIDPIVSSNLHLFIVKPL